MHDNHRTETGLKPVDLYIKSNPGLLSGLDATNPRDWHHTVTKSHLLSTFADNYRKIQVGDRKQSMTVFVSLPALKGVEQLSKSVTRRGYVPNPKSKLTKLARNKRQGKTKSDGNLPTLPPIHGDSGNIDTEYNEDCPTSAFLTETNVAREDGNPAEAPSATVGSFSETRLPRAVNATQTRSDNSLALSNSRKNTLVPIDELADMAKIRHKIREYSKRNEQNVPNRSERLPAPKQLRPLSGRYQELKDARRKHVPPVEKVEHGEQYKLKQKSLLKLKLSETDIIAIVKENQQLHQGDLFTRPPEMQDWSKVPSKVGPLTRQTKTMSSASSVSSLATMANTGGKQTRNPLETLQIESQMVPSIRRGEESRSTFHTSHVTSHEDSETKSNAGRFIYYDSPRKTENELAVDKRIKAVNITILESGPTSKCNQTQSIPVEQNSSTQIITPDNSHNENSDTRNKHNTSQASSHVSKRSGVRQKTVFKKFQRLEVFDRKNKTVETVQEEEPARENTQVAETSEQQERNKRKRYLPLTRPQQYKLAPQTNFPTQNYFVQSNFDPFSDLYVGLCECMLCPECKGVQEELLSIQEGRRLPRNPPNSESSQRREIRRGSDVTDSSRRPSLAAQSKGASKAPSAKTITEENHSEIPEEVPATNAQHTDTIHTVSPENDTNMPNPEGENNEEVITETDREHSLTNDSSKSYSIARQTCNTEDYLRPTCTTTTTYISDDASLSRKCDDQ